MGISIMSIMKSVDDREVEGLRALREVKPRVPRSERDLILAELRALTLEQPARPFGRA